MLPDFHSRWRWIALCAALFALLFARSMTRRFDLDEHQFVAPAVFLAQDGLVPYRDYPYFHMPNLVLLYAAMMAWAPYKLLAARVISVACGTGIVALLFATGWQRLQHVPIRSRWGLVGGLIAMLLCSRMFLYTQGWAWNHEASTLSALVAVLLYRRAIERSDSPNVWLFTAGFFAANAACIRLSYALIVLPLAGMLVVGPSQLTRRERWIGLVFAMAGGLMASLPALVCLALYRSRFLFGNLGYASLSTAAYAAAGAPAMTPLEKFLYFLRCFASDPGNAVLFMATTVALWRIHQCRLWADHASDRAAIEASGASYDGAAREARDALNVWSRSLRAITGHDRLGSLRDPCRFPVSITHSVLLGLCLLPALWIGATGPTPAQYQYWFMLVPFALLLVFDVLATVPVDELLNHRLRPAFQWATIIAVLIGLPRGYWRVIDLPFPERWTPVAVHRTGEWIATHVQPGDRVLTLDPLHPLEAGLHVHPHFAVGRFPMIVGPFTSSEQRQEQKLLWGRELNEFLCRETPDAILCDQRTIELVPWFVDYAEDLGFCRNESPDRQFVLWTRQTNTDLARERATEVRASLVRSPARDVHR